jgi:hypothetical protein
MEVHDVFHVSLPDRYVNSVPINISNAVPVNNRATYIERRQRITSPRLTRTPLNRWTNITARIRQSRGPGRQVLARRTKKSRRMRDCRRPEMDSHVRRRQPRYKEASAQVFSHWVSCALHALVRISRFTRRHGGERESHDVLLGVTGLCRSFRAPGGSRLERGIM